VYLYLGLILIAFIPMFWLNEPGGVLGGGGLKCVKPGFGGFRGVWAVF
jgi:hypothetical protein